MVNLKTTIDYNNTLIKAKSNCTDTVSDSETHSDIPTCIKDSERYYCILYLHLARQLAIASSINNCILTEEGYFRNCFAVKGGFLKPQKLPSIRPCVSINFSPDHDIITPLNLTA